MMIDPLFNYLYTPLSLLFDPLLSTQFCQNQTTHAVQPRSDNMTVRATN